MATGASVSELYINLGLNLSDLETGFVTASQTVAANISRLNRKSNLVRIRSEIDIAGLDETADAERILQIRTNALNQQMQIQRDRIRILDAEYQNLVQSQGANSTAAQRATVRLERERLALANLDRELRNLNDSSSQQSAGILDELNDALPQMPTKLQAVEMAFGAMTAGIGAATASVKELMTNFREIQQQSYELNMPFEETRDFLREMKLAGGDIGDIEGFIRGISDAWVTGEYDDKEIIALRKHGAEITDATGRLKNFKDLTEEVYRAWEKADAAGEGIEFLQMVGGEMGVRDILQYFQRLKEAKEDAAKIYEANIDNTQLHELDRMLMRVEEQSIELKNTIGNIFTPAAQAAGEKFFQMLHDGTEFIVENKDEIQTFGRVTVGVFEKLNSLLPSGQFSTILEDSKAIYDELKKNQESFKPSDEMKKYLDAQTAANPISVLKDAFSESDIVKRAIEEQKIYNGELEETNTVAGRVEKGLKALSESQKNYGDVISQYGETRTKQFKDELADLQLEIDFKDDDYVKAIAELDLWRKRELEDKNFVTQGERDAINELYEARKKLIDLERDDNLADIRESVDAEFKSSIDARIDKINEEKEAWVSAGMDAAEAMELSQKRIDKAMSDAAKDFEREVDSIKGKTQTLYDKIFEIDHSQYENDLRKIQQEYLQTAQELQESGVLSYYKNDLDYLFGRQQQELAKRAAKDKNYRKSPEGTTERGGNGIMVISGDKITDDGLIQSRQKEIGLLADENQILAQLLQKQRQELSGDTWAMLAQKVQSIQQPQITLPPQQQQQTGIQIIEGDKVVSMPQMPTEPLQEFGYNLQQLNAQMQQIPQIEKPAEQSTPIESLQTLKTSTEGLTAAQNALAENFRAMSEMRLENPANIQFDIPTESFQTLKNSTLELTNAQNILADKLRSLSEMQFAAPAISQQYNLAPDKSFDLPLLVNLLPTESLQALQTSTTELTAAQDILANKIRSISEMQITSLAITQSDITPDMPLNNLDVPLSTILHEMQAKRETTISTETIVMPLNNIASIAQNILSAMGNANQPDITVSPNIRIDLGGAYVFDNGMKKTLTDDITKEVVGAITTAVNQATRQSSYSYGA